jgi:hypothetical protein
MTPAELDLLVADATAHCSSPAEELTSFQTLIEEGMYMPFEITLGGARVVIERIEIDDAGDLVAVYRDARDAAHSISVLQLPPHAIADEGAQWIDAYRQWLHRRN